MKHFLPAFLAILLFASFSSAQEFIYNDAWNDEGIQLKASDKQKVVVSHSIEKWNLTDISINRENLKKVELPGNMLPNDAGAPDLPSEGRYIAIPQGAEVQVNVTSSRMEIMKDIDLAPAPEIPQVTYDGPLNYTKNEEIWTTNAFYPAEPVQISEKTQIRGLDLVMLGISPYQYNPVTKELRIYRDLEIEVEFVGGTEQFGEDRLRSRWWDPIMADLAINSEVLPEMDYSSMNNSSRSTGCEYLIIVPDDPDFLAWADTLAAFRNKQGIATDVITTTDIGGNTVVAIENYVDNAYNTWDQVPSAILLMADYGTSGSTIISPIYDFYCASDNIYADVTGNHMPDIVFSRMTAQNETHLETMVNKIIDYETNPPTDADFYDKPITALGWQTERWFQICIETVGGYFKNELGKNPVRINEVYGGNPNTDPWSTAPNTGTILNYFGPNGLGYLPADPADLGNWDGGSASDINNAINDGSFILLHRDHGYELGWGEPDYDVFNINGLSNDELTFVYSVNCLTGKFNIGGECFAEKFHRYQPGGALGLVAASEVSYSFVNDTYVWGAFDNMWPDFMPDYGSTPTERGLLTSFSNAAGKYFLQQSNWPYNSGSKAVTYNLFHHHGGAFSTLYSEVPDDLLVISDPVILGGYGSYTVQADDGSLIALSVDGEIIGVADGTGGPVTFNIEPQTPGTIVDLVVTKTNYFRYEDQITVISPDDPYVIYEDHMINDQGGNNNGMLDYNESPMVSVNMWNIGNEDALDVEVKVTTTDPYVIITDSTENYGDIMANQTVMINDGFSLVVADSVPDQHMIVFDVVSTNPDSTWASTFVLTALAPVMEFMDFTINDENGNDNGRIDPGETVELMIDFANNGASEAFNVMIELVCDDNYIDIQTGAQSYGDMPAYQTAQSGFTVYAAENTPGGYQPPFEFVISADYNISQTKDFTTVVGQFAALVIEMDENEYSGPAIMEAMQELSLFSEYATEIPNDMKDYKSVFLCLGNHNSNHILTNNEALRLIQFLQSGGKLYMEGRLTWREVEQTQLHQLFNIEPVSTSMFVYENFYGQDGTFTEGMEFEFEGALPVNNYYIDAEDPAFVIFRSEDEDYGAAVAHDAGDYKTIGSVFEFGGLADGQSPSTKTELMEKYLDFFGDLLTDVDDLKINSNHEVMTYPNPASNEVHFAFNNAETGSVKLEVYNISGQKVATVFEGQMTKGNQDVVWNTSLLSGEKAPAGFYIYRLSSNSGTTSGKILIVE
jgi:hypothetical protein